MRTQYWNPFATGMLLAMLCVSTVAPASAQPVPAPNRSVQAVPPAQGAIAWGPQDNCAYRFQNGSWYRQDICRIMQGPSVYITYRPSTGQRLAAYDESEPGWIKATDLTVANPFVVAYPTVAGRNVMLLVNNQWMDVATAQRWLGQQQPGSVHSTGQDVSTSILLGQMRRNQEARAEEARKAEEEARLKRERDKRFYDDQRRTKEYYEEERIKRDRIEQEAIKRAQTNRDNRKALDDLADARRRQRQADDAAAAARREASRAADEAAAAARRARNR